MRLWSVHSPDFSTLEGNVDHSKSPYFETVPGISEAYQRVWDHVGTDQIIWCWATTEGHFDVDADKVQWVLDVPEAEILALIDDYVWNRILNIRCHPPRRLYWEWRDRSLELFPTDANARQQFMDDQHQAFWTEKPLSGDWWNHVFVPDTKRDSTSAIVRHPVQYAWVISRERSGNRRRR